MGKGVGSPRDLEDGYCKKDERCKTSWAWS